MTPKFKIGDYVLTDWGRAVIYGFSAEHMDYMLQYDDNQGLGMVTVAMGNVEFRLVVSEREEIQNIIGYDS
jgi:hypothetical protein